MIKRLLWILFITFFFLLGVYVESHFPEATEKLPELPVEDIIEYGEETIIEYQESREPKKTPPSPCNHLKSVHFEAYETKFTIHHPRLMYARIKDSGSMEPVMNGDSHSLEYRPYSSDDICQGDIITFEHNNKTLIHRVMIIAEDSEGWYAITKGDNNANADYPRVRYSQVKGVVLGVLY